MLRSIYVRLCVVLKIILRVLAEFASISPRSSMTKGVYAQLCIHSKIILRVLASFFWDLRYTHVVTRCIMMVVIQIGACRVFCIIFDCASCVFVCMIWWNLSVLLMDVFADHFILLWPIFFTTLFYSLCTVSSSFCCLWYVYLFGI